MKVTSEDFIDARDLRDMWTRRAEFCASRRGATARADAATARQLAAMWAVVVFNTARALIAQGVEREGGAA